MKLELNPSLATPQAVSGTAPAGKPPEAAAPGDGIEISKIFSALDQSARINRIATAIEGGSYQASSAATGKALVEDALSGGN